MSASKEPSPASREWPRLAPQQAVTVAVYELNQPVAYGVVSNVSEGGACMVTDQHFAFGKSVDLKISFYRRTELFEAAAQIVWVKALAAPAGEARCHGLRFNALSDMDRHFLREVLHSSDFRIVSDPLTGHEFEELLDDLRTDLDRLGKKLADQ